MQCLYFRCCATTFLFLFFFIQDVTYPQNEPELEEITVFLNVYQIGGKEIPAILRGEVLYLPVTTVFNLLKIRNTSSPLYDTVSGFFIYETATFLIDQQNNRMDYQGKRIEFNPGDLIRTDENLYLRLNYFGEVFGLECTFDFRSLSVDLKTKLELPAIRVMRQEIMRQNIIRLKGEIKADTIIPRSYPVFHFGMADWSFNTAERVMGRTDVRVGLTLGSIIAGGEADVSLIYGNNEPFTEKKIYYLWHFANNNLRYLRQILVGKVPSQAISALPAPVIGVMATNTPTSFRRSFGTYTLSDYTEPGWITELYVNNIMVDYVKADASGFFTFEVPLVYGSSVVTLHFYGPWGEERSLEKRMNIPYNFLPSNTFEYSLSAGMIEDHQNNRFSRANFHYGIGKWITIGGGVEYNSSVARLNIFPFLEFSMHLSSNILISGEYIHGVRMKGQASYRLLSGLQFELNYVHYQPEQKAVGYSYLEERKATISLPVHTRNFNSLFRLTADQIILPRFSYLTSELLISGSVHGVSTNLTTNALFTNPVHPYIYSSASLGFRLPHGFIITPQTQFQYNPFRFINLKLEIQKQLFNNANVNLTYDQSFRGQLGNFQIGFRYTFTFAQCGFNASYNNNTASFVQSANGSLLFSGKTHFVGANNRSSVGKGGFLLLGFFDFNNNGHRDPGEPKVANLNFSISGGRVEPNKRDSTIRVFDLEPFTDYFIVIDKNSFDNIAWQIQKPTISVAIDPNQFKLVEVPVSVLGEVTGTVYYNKSTGKEGQERIIVSFYQKDSTFLGSTMTESDGYFSLLAFKPGNYFASIDKRQLKKLNMFSTPDVVPFEIKHTQEGDIAEGIDFLLNDIAVATSPSNENLQLQEKPVVTDSGIYLIEVDSFFTADIAETLKKYLAKTVKQSLEVVFEDGMYKLLIKDIIGKNEAELILKKLEGAGINVATIRKIKNL